MRQQIVNFAHECLILQIDDHLNCSRMIINPFIAIELAPDVGPVWLGKSGFIRRTAGRDFRVANEALSAFYCRSSYADAPHFSRRGRDLAVC